MKSKKSCTLIIIILLFICLNAKGNKNMIWEITSFDENKVYVLGSIHAASDNLYPLNKIVEEKYLECSQIAVEADITKKQTKEIQTFLMATSLYEDGTIAEHISENYLDKLKNICKKYNLNFDSYKNYKPWFWAMTLEQIKIQHTNLDFEKGIDLYFLKKAKQDKKEILELEGLFEQISFLSGLSDSTQISFLELTVNDSLDYVEELKQVVKAWKMGKTKELDFLLLKEFNQNKHTKQLYEILVVERNIRIAKKIGEYLATGENVFVIAGAAHFVGTESVLQILRKKGYFIKRL
ncbi:MAG: TraB/GumN family protein [Candidatus Cloacimonetes bacterium]|nr:TraB/GumN family protein [Candidatus Cloacimonadota bacterium]